MCVSYACSVHGDLARSLGLWELGLQRAVSTMTMLGTEPGSSGEADSASNH